MTPDLLTWRTGIVFMYAVVMYADIIKLTLLTFKTFQKQFSLCISSKIHLFINNFFVCILFAVLLPSRIPEDQFASSVLVFVLFPSTTSPWKCQGLFILQTVSNCMIKWFINSFTKLQPPYTWGYCKEWLTYLFSSVVLKESLCLEGKSFEARTFIKKLPQVLVLEDPQVLKSLSLSLTSKSLTDYS